jgi:2-iminobutanoate/2-iminopropanoate deaminase
MKTVNIPGAPAPGGHYSPAVISNGLIFVSGQLPVDPVTGEKKTATFDMQCRQALDNVRAILQAAGSDLLDVVKVTAYITHIDDWAEFNTIYAEYFGSHRPARAVVPVGPLHWGCRVEIEAIAEVR